MLDKQKQVVYDETEEMDVPFLPWLEEAQLQYYEETKELTPQERALYWANIRTELNPKKRRKAEVWQPSAIPMLVGAAD